ncbi:MAG: putative porin [Bacteroidales bacterium]|nr:putative porin [Bacteroidales bacterium]
MKYCPKYLILISALCLSNVAFGQFEYSEPTDTTNLPPEPERREIARREGGSANRGIVYFFYENPLNVGRPHLRFIDTVKSLFHRYDPIMRNNAFRADRGNLGLISDDLEFSFRNDILFSYGRSPFELFRYTPFNTKFYQNTIPYVELYYVQGGQRKQNFRMLFTQNVLRGLNVGAEYNIIMAPGLYNRSFTRHNNIRVFSNFISENQRYRVVAGYFFNHFQSNENGGITMRLDSAADFSNKRIVPIRLQQAENVWRENSFYLRQSYHFGMSRNRRQNEIRNGNGVETKDVCDCEDECKCDNGPENGNRNESCSASNGIDNSRINFGSLSHSLEVKRFHTIFNDRQLNPENYPAIFRDSTQTRDSTFVELIRNTLSWNIGDVTSFQNSQFINLSFGATMDLARVRTGYIAFDTTEADTVQYFRDFNREFSYLYPFARLRLNFQNRYFLSAGIKYQTRLATRDLRTFTGISANARFDYFFNRMRSDDGFFAEANFTDVLPRPFQQFYTSNSFQWDNSFKNPQTLHFAAGARWRGFRLRSEIATFNNFIYLTPTNFAQTNETFSIFKTSLERTFRFWRILALDTRLVYQHNTSNTIMQFPAFSTRSALYLDFVLLGTTPMQVGFEAFYNTPFHSRFFNPALGMFYDQQQLQTGGFTFADAFLNLRIARANVFFKMSNLGGNLWGHNYVMTNGYPLPYRTFSFGVLWRFYD